MKTVQLLLAREHRLELAAILVVGSALLLFSVGLLSLPLLLGAVFFGLFFIAK